MRLKVSCGKIKHIVQVFFGQVWKLFKITVLSDRDCKYLSNNVHYAELLGDIWWVLCDQVMSQSKFFTKIALTWPNFNGFSSNWCQSVGNIPGYEIMNSGKTFEKISPFFGFREYVWEFYFWNISQPERVRAKIFNRVLLDANPRRMRPKMLKSVQPFSWKLRDNFSSRKKWFYRHSSERKPKPK